jgi:Ca-activated chloride channel family protein
MSQRVRQMAILAAALALAGCQQGAGGNVIPYDRAAERLDSLVADIDWREAYVTQMSVGGASGAGNLADTLPPIDDYALPVLPRQGSGAVVVEIFASTEKSGSGEDGWLVEVATDFNRSNVSLNSGGTAQVAIRKIASGTGYQFIASGKYVPAGFTPSNRLWIEMVSAAGVPVQEIRPRLVGNVAGVVMKEAVFTELQEQYGQDPKIPDIIDAVIQGTVAMGYTNPFASSTGLNFLQTVLASAVGGDVEEMLGAGAVSTFEAFQRGVPFVSLTTLQMRDSVQRDGSLDAFVMEYQTYIKVDSLRRGYKFIPFGVRHDNPLYAIGDVDPRQLEALESFASFAEQADARRTADRYGFNALDDYRPAGQTPSGQTLIEAQQLWKEKKDSGNPIVAVFLADISGSMRGLRISQLRDALASGAEFIAPTNYIGLATFGSNVFKILPVAAFDGTQRARFISAAEGLDATGGNTAMYDGIVVALQMLAEATARVPNSRPLLFVLTDGETNTGLKYNKVDDVLAGMRVPIYTISYGGTIADLQRVATLNEAASLTASETNISFQIGALLNAQM